MSGGSSERVAAYINNGNKNLTDETRAKAVYEGAAKYKNVYYSTVKDGSISDAADYPYTNPNYSGTYPNGYTKKYGDALWETSHDESGVHSWCGDSSIFPTSYSPFFYRGAKYDNTSYAGIFYFNGNSGVHDSGYGFRVVVPVL